MSDLTPERSARLAVFIGLTATAQILGFFGLALAFYLRVSDWSLGEIFVLAGLAPIVRWLGRLIYASEMQFWESIAAGCGIGLIILGLIRLGVIAR